MIRASILIPIVLAICALLSCASAAAAVDDWRVAITPFGQIFPALDLSQASHARSARHDDSVAILGDGNGLVALRMKARHDGERVRARIDVAPWFSAPAELDVRLALVGREYELRPRLEWNIARLSAQTRPLPTTLDIELRRDEDAPQHRHADVSLRPLNEALYFVRDGADTVDLSWSFAAFVDAHAAAVDALLDSAGKSGIVEKFDGYADTSPSVMRQTWAIWHALARRGIRYSGADPGIERGPRVFSQRVRFLAETWNGRNANCIDGSVLLASAFERIGLASFLVLVPGHAFVGVYTDAQARHAVYLETTLLGTRVPRLAGIPAYANAIELDATRRASLAGFESALAAGAARHARVARKLDGHHRPDYEVIDIAAARRFGIRAISTESASSAAVGAN